MSASAISSASSQVSFRRGPDQNKQPLQYERWKIVSVLCEFNSLTYVPFPEGVAKLVVDYVAKSVVFGPQDWREYFALDVGEEQLPEEALQWWSSLDAVTPFDGEGNPIFNYETHHGFYYIPAKGPGRVPLDLETFDQLAQQPKLGNASRFRLQVEDLRQNLTVQVVESCWIAMRKNVLFREKTAAQQKALMDELNAETESQMQAMRKRENGYDNLTGTRYENFPDLRHLCILVRAHFAKTGERLLGNETGVEGQMTYSRTNDAGTIGERIFQIAVGYHRPIEVRDSVVSGGLYLYGHFPDNVSKDFGVAALRKFPLSKTISS